LVAGGVAAFSHEVAAVSVWWIALAGALLGACGAALGLGSRRRARALEERLARLEVAVRTGREREAQRPRIRASLEQAVDVRWYLTIENEGQGSARDFTISIDGSSLEQSSMVDAGQLDLTQLSRIDGRGALRIPLKAARRPERLQVELSWSDGAGELGLYAAELAGSSHEADASEQG
jgi:hypothetical protein